MTDKWNTTHRKTPSEPANIVIQNIEIHRRLRSFPVYPILCYFYMLPKVNLRQSIRSRFHSTSLMRLTLVVMNFAFLLLVLLHDFIYFFMNKTFWGKYFANGSRIITLLLAIRFLLIFWKNAASAFLFMYKSKNLYPYLVQLNDLVIQIPVALKAEKRERIILAVVYFFPFLCMGFRVAVSIYALTQTDADVLVQVGFVLAPLWLKLSFYHLAEIIGAITCIATYGQIATFVLLLKDGCAHLNGHLIALHSRLKKGDVTSGTFQIEIRSLRDLQELLIDLCNKHEDLFSLQILVAILNNSFIVFSSLASFFTPGVTTELIIIYFLSIIGFIYVILVLPFFHIQLNEESNKTIELVQAIIHRRSQVAHTECYPVEEYVLMSYFLQRAINKPLVVTAGGFMQLTRSFIVSIGAVILGFALFLMERVEGQKSNGTAEIGHPSNNSEPLDWNYDDTPTLVDELVDTILSRKGHFSNVSAIA